MGVPEHSAPTSAPVSVLLVLLVVWIVVVVAVLAVLVLGGIAFGVLSALHRLIRELRGLEGELRPVLAEVQATTDRIAAQRADDGAMTPR
jgi:hypothetical protein